MPSRSERRALERARYGSMSRPVRFGVSNPLLNSWDGWATERPPVTAWITPSTAGYGPLGEGHPYGWPGGTDGLPAALERGIGQLIGPLVSVLPVRWYTGSWRADPSAVEFAEPLWHSDPMLIGGRPGPGGAMFPAPSRMPGPTFWATVLQDALMFGRGFFCAALDAENQPLAGSLRHLSPAMVEVDEEGGGWRIGDDQDVVVTDANGMWTMGGRTWKLVHIREPWGDGTGVVGRHGATLRLSVHVRGFATDQFRSAVPAGILKVTGSGPFNKADADRLKQQWTDVNGPGSIGVLSASVDWQNITTRVLDSALVEVDGLVLRALAHALNLPASALDAGTAGGSMTYSSISMDRQNITDSSIKPWASVYQEALTTLLPFGSWTELDFRGYLQTDPAQRVAYYSAGIRDGWLSKADIRRLEKLPIRPGDELNDVAPQDPPEDPAPLEVPDEPDND